MCAEHEGRSPVEISFVLPAYNEALLIGETVARLREAARELGVCHEVIVVNDNSDDDTAEVAQAAGALVIDVENRQIAATRNAGARVAKGAVLVFVDADTLVPTWTLQNALLTLENGSIGGGALARFRGKVPWHATLLIDAIQMPLRFIGGCGGCFMFMRRWAYDAAGGYDEALYASEEIWLAKRLARLGRFHVLWQPTWTSGRKVRQYSVGQLLSFMFRVTLPFWSVSVTKREGLEVWYSGEREAAGMDD